MPEEAPQPASGDPMAEAVLADIRTLLAIKARLPFIEALAQELERLDAPVRNDIVFGIARDSFDVLVIHLASLREKLTKTEHSTLNRLTDDLPRLRRFTPDDCEPRSQITGGAAEEPALTAYFKQEMVDRMNRSFDHLFPNGMPVTREHVKDLIGRFRTETEATDADRNRVRAHRYERLFDPSYYQTIAEVEQQIAVFERYLGELYLVLTKKGHVMHPLVLASPERTAKDIADVIVNGSINQAVFRYGVVSKDRPDEDRWYWLRRKRFFESGNRLPQKDE